jgi:hypothetical protein
VGSVVVGSGAYFLHQLNAYFHINGPHAAFLKGMTNDDCFERVVSDFSNTRQKLIQRIFNERLRNDFFNGFVMPILICLENPYIQ